MLQQLDVSSSALKNVERRHFRCIRRCGQKLAEPVKTFSEVPASVLLQLVVGFAADLRASVFMFVRVGSPVMSECGWVFVDADFPLFHDLSSFE